MTGGGRKFHIVFVSRELGIFRWTGGIGAYVWDLARRIVQEGHRCTVICSSYTANGKGDETRERVRVITIPDDHLLSRSPLTYPFRFKKHFSAYRNRVADTLDGLIDTTGVDLVEFGEYGAESFVWQDRPRRIPMVVRWHTPIGRQFKLANVVYYPIKRWMRWATLQTLFSADAVTFPSKWMADRVAETVDIGRLFYRVIPNGVNYYEWSSHATSEAKEPKQEINVLYAGTLGARKGFVDLINAVKILRRDGYPIILTLLGKHTRYAKIVIWRERSSISQGWLRAPGAVDRGQLGRYYAEADVCCFPSWFETVGIVCLEAMACGGIVIGSANSGMAEVIEDGQDGFLAPPRAQKDLALIIKKALSLPPEKKLEMRRKAGQKILKTFDNSVIVGQMLDFYRAVIDRFGHG
jgi:glycogen synthase